MLQEHHFNLSEQILVQDAPWNLIIKKYVSLQPGFLVKMDVWGKVRSSIILSTRWLGIHLKCGYDIVNLQLVEYKALLLRLIMLNANNEAHPGIDKTDQCLRNIAWIVRGCGPVGLQIQSGKTASSAG